jgi:hypothetical protein
LGCEITSGTGNCRESLFDAIFDCFAGPLSDVEPDENVSRDPGNDAHEAKSDTNPEKNCAEESRRAALGVDKSENRGRNEHQAADQNARAF